MILQESDSSDYDNEEEQRMTITIRVRKILRKMIYSLPSP
jgi:hypothetical protein